MSMRQSHYTSNNYGYDDQDDARSYRTSASTSPTASLGHYSHVHRPPTSAHAESIMRGRSSYVHSLPDNRRSSSASPAFSPSFRWNDNDHHNHHNHDPESYNGRGRYPYSSHHHDYSSYSDHADVTDLTYYDKQVDYRSFASLPALSTQQPMTTTTSTPNSRSSSRVREARYFDLTDVDSDDGYFESDDRVSRIRRHGDLVDLSHHISVDEEDNDEDIILHDNIIDANDNDDDDDVMDMKMEIDVDSMMMEERLAAIDLTQVPSILDDLGSQEQQDSDGSYAELIEEDMEPEQIEEDEVASVSSREREQDLMQTRQAKSVGDGGESASTELIKDSQKQAVEKPQEASSSHPEPTSNTQRGNSAFSSTVSRGFVELPAVDYGFSQSTAIDLIDTSSADEVEYLLSLHNKNPANKQDVGHIGNGDQYTLLSFMDVVPTTMPGQHPSITFQTKAITHQVKAQVLAKHSTSINSSNSDGSADMLKELPRFSGKPPTIGEVQSVVSSADPPVDSSDPPGVLKHKLSKTLSEDDADQNKARIVVKDPPEEQEKFDDICSVVTPIARNGGKPVPAPKSPSPTSAFSSAARQQEDCPAFIMRQLSSPAPPSSPSLIRSVNALTRSSPVSVSNEKLAHSKQLLPLVVNYIKEASSTAQSPPPLVVTASPLGVTPIQVEEPKKTSTTSHDVIVLHDDGDDVDDDDVDNASEHIHYVPIVTQSPSSSSSLSQHGRETRDEPTLRGSNGKRPREHTVPSEQMNKNDAPSWLPSLSNLHSVMRMTKGTILVKAPPQNSLHTTKSTSNDIAVNTCCNTAGEAESAAECLLSDLLEDSVHGPQVASSSSPKDDIAKNDDSDNAREEEKEEKVKAEQVVAAVQVVQEVQPEARIGGMQQEQGHEEGQSAHRPIVISLSAKSEEGPEGSDGRSSKSDHEEEKKSEDEPSGHDEVAPERLVTPAGDTAHDDDSWSPQESDVAAQTTGAAQKTEVKDSGKSSNRILSLIFGANVKPTGCELDRQDTLSSQEVYCQEEAAKTCESKDVADPDMDSDSKCYTDSQDIQEATTNDMESISNCCSENQDIQEATTNDMESISNCCSESQDIQEATTHDMDDEVDEEKRNKEILQVMPVKSLVLKEARLDAEATYAALCFDDAEEKPPVEYRILKEARVDAEATYAALCFEEAEVKPPVECRVRKEARVNAEATYAALSVEDPEDDPPVEEASGGSVSGGSVEEQDDRATEPATLPHRDAPKKEVPNNNESVIGTLLGMWGSKAKPAATSTPSVKPHEENKNSVETKKSDSWESLSEEAVTEGKVIKTAYAHQEENTVKGTVSEEEVAEDLIAEVIDEAAEKAVVAPDDDDAGSNPTTLGANEESQSLPDGLPRESKWEGASKPGNVRAKASAKRVSFKEVISEISIIQSYEEPAVEEEQPVSSTAFDAFADVWHSKMAQIADDKGSSQIDKKKDEPIPAQAPAIPETPTEKPEKEDTSTEPDECSDQKEASPQSATEEPSSFGFTAFLMKAATDTLSRATAKPSQSAATLSDLDKNEASTAPGPDNQDSDLVDEELRAYARQVFEVAANVAASKLEKSESESVESADAVDTDAYEELLEELPQINCLSPEMTDQIKQEQEKVLSQVSRLGSFLVKSVPAKEVEAKLQDVAQGSILGGWTSFKPDIAAILSDLKTSSLPAATPQTDTLKGGGVEEKKDTLSFCDQGSADKEAVKEEEEEEPFSFCDGGRVGDDRVTSALTRFRIPEYQAHSLEQAPSDVGSEGQFCGSTPITAGTVDAISLKGEDKNAKEHDLEVGNFIGDVIESGLSEVVVNDQIIDMTFDQESKGSVVSALNDDEAETPAATLGMERLQVLVTNLMTHEYGFEFSTPLDLKDFPAYRPGKSKYQPMDLGTILR